MVEQLLNMLRRWPLLLVGLALFLWGISLADGEDRSDARALLLGVASVLVGAGMVVVVGTEVSSRYEKRHHDSVDDEVSPESMSMERDEGS